MEVFVGLFVLLLVPAVIVAGYAVNGYVLSVLWGWFITPVFHIPPISVSAAVGLAMVVSYLTYHYDGSNSEKESAGNAIFNALVVRPLFVLLAGWLLHTFFA